MTDAQSHQQRVLAGRYRLIELLGSGGFGTIWKAEHLVLQAPVAVKLIAAEIAQDEGAVERFLREARAVATVRSPHVVQILDYGVDQGTPYMAMELLEGETLGARLRRKGRLGSRETLRVITHVCRAMTRAHGAGIVHRDLKPENVFLVQNEGDEIAKVLDFGVAKLDSAMSVASAQTRTGSLLGTPYYMSPEQVHGTKHVDQRSDLWAIGVIAFECLIGRKPFSSSGLGDLVLQICVHPKPVPSEVGDVPAEFDQWFEQATNRAIEARFQSARELARELARALHEEPLGRGHEEEGPQSHGSPDTTTPPALDESGSDAARPSAVATIDVQAATLSLPAPAALAPESADRAPASRPSAPRSARGATNEGVGSAEDARGSTDTRSARSASDEAQRRSQERGEPPRRHAVQSVAMISLVAGVGVGWFVLAQQGDPSPRSTRAVRAERQTPAGAAVANANGADLRVHQPRLTGASTPHASDALAASGAGGGGAEGAPGAADRALSSAGSSGAEGVDDATSGRGGQRDGGAPWPAAAGANSGTVPRGRATATRRPPERQGVGGADAALELPSTRAARAGKTRPAGSSVPSSESAADAGSGR